MIKVIKATKHHLDDIAELFDAYRQFYGMTPDPVSSKAFIGERMERKESLVYLASYQGVSAGFIQIYPSFSSVSMFPIWILNDLYVHPDFRRRKVAEHLLCHLELEAKLQGIGRISLETAPDNIKAQALYLNHQFEKSPFLIFEKDMTGEN